MKKMKSKSIIFALSLVLILASCNTNSSSSGDVGSSSTSSSGGDVSSSDTSGSGTSSSELPPLNDPDVQGLTASDSWPQAAIDNYLTYSTNIDMPALESEVRFHYGVVYNYLELDFFRVMTRVRTTSDFNAYKSTLEIYDFEFELEEDEKGKPIYYGTSMYDDVRLYMQLINKSGYYEVNFDFFDGEGDDYEGLRAEGNVAFFDLKTQAAITSKKPTRVKWEVRPASLVVLKGSAGYPVGSDNYAHISNPLRIYAGNIVKFSVSKAYYISEIYVLAASGYLDKFLDEGTFSNQLDVDRKGVDTAILKPTQNMSTLDYERLNVTNVGQTRILEFKVTFAPYNAK